MHSGKRNTTGMKRYGLWLIIAVLLGATGLVGAGMEAKSRNPVFCASCHEMSMAAEAWSHSTHQTVACRECHREVDLARMLGVHLTGDGQARLVRLAAQPLPQAENCSRCHPADRVCKNPDLFVAHDVHAAMTVECVQCHVNPGHDEALAGIDREACLRCHNGAMAPDSCETCHRQVPGTAVGEGGRQS